MRDFRDAKAMAHTLRESLATRAVPISHSESLELISKILGVADWNTLSAMLQDRGEAESRPDRVSEENTGAEEGIDRRRAEQARPRVAVPFEPLAFDKYVGYYELAPGFIFTITRDGDRFQSQLPGQPIVEFYPESSTKFFAKVVAAQLSFVTNASGQVTALILHQNGHERRAPRIEAAQANASQATLKEQFKSQIRDPQTEAALRRHVEDLVAGSPPDYETMGPALVEAVKEQRVRIQSMVATLGGLRSIAFVGVSQTGFDVYNVWFEHGVQHWSIRLGADGRIEGLFVTPGP